MARQKIPKLFEINDRDYLAVSYKLGKAQIWKTGTGRDEDNMKWYGSLGGNFTNPKMTLVFQTPEELSYFEQSIYSGSIAVKFYDTRTMDMRQAIFYRANYEVSIEGFYDEGSEQYFDTVDIEFIAHDPD